MEQGRSRLSEVFSNCLRRMKGSVIESVLAKVAYNFLVG